MLGDLGGILSRTLKQVRSQVEHPPEAKEVEAWARRDPAPLQRLARGAKDG